MSIAKTLMSLGNWIEKHFPEKVTAAEVDARLRDIETHVGALGSLVEDIKKVYFDRLELHSSRLTELERKADLTNSEMNKTKIMLLTQRQTAGR